VDLVTSGSVDYRQRDVQGNIVATLEDLYGAANEVRGRFEFVLQSMATALSLSSDRIVIPPLKGRDRAAEKAKDDYGSRTPGPSFAWLYDVVRGCIKCDSEQEICSAMAYLQSLDAASDAEDNTCWNGSGDDHSRIRIVRMKNRFVQPTPGGFRDITINISIRAPKELDSDRIYVTHICELQIHLAPLYLLAKQLGSHSVYEHFRMYFRGDQTTVEARLQLLDEILGTSGTSVDGPDAPERCVPMRDNSGTSACPVSGLAVPADSTLAADAMRSALVTLVDSVLASADLDRLGRLEQLVHLMCDYDLLVKIKLSKLAILDAAVVFDADEAADEPAFVGAVSDVAGGPPAERASRSPSLLQAQLCVELAEVHALCGDYSSGKGMIERAIELRTQALGPQHPETLLAQQILGVIHESTGYHGGALRCLAHAYQGLREALGDDSEHTLNVACRLARLHQTMDDWFEARCLFEKCCITRSRVYGADHMGTISILDHLACLYAGYGDHGQAQAVLQCALDSRERVLGIQHEDTLLNLHNLGMLHMAQRSFAPARALFEKAIGGLERSLGADHFRTLHCVSSLAEVCLAMGDLPAAQVIGSCARYVCCVGSRQCERRVVWQVHADCAAIGLACVMGTAHSSTQRALSLQHCVRSALHLGEPLADGRGLGSRSSSSSSLGWRSSSDEEASQVEVQLQLQKS
jgi:tetratricopeptide (TPR) repeat protein